MGQLGVEADRGVGTAPLVWWATNDNNTNRACVSGHDGRLRQRRQAATKQQGQPAPAKDGHSADEWMGRVLMVGCDVVVVLVRTEGKGSEALSLSNVPASCQARRTRMGAELVLSAISSRSYAASTVHHNAMTTR